ncbi:MULTISPECIES: hypothetical protein [unclassified Streptomyces]|uniref:hypothetical protein n=1 Tax=unclassified Streptomyces TaxID=2593676 RepID=UPI0033C866EC
MTTPLYEVVTREGTDGAMHPDEALWTPTAENAVDAGFLHRDGLYLTGVGEEGEPPIEFVALGHGHTWTALCAAGAAYLKDRDYEPDDATLRQPLPERRHAVFLRHPHPDHPCSCAWDDSWRLVYVPEGTPGAIPVTVLRRPGGGR